MPYRVREPRRSQWTVYGSSVRVTKVYFGTGKPKNPRLAMWRSGSLVLWTRGGKWGPVARLTVGKTNARSREDSGCLPLGELSDSIGVETMDW